ncbi:MAG: PilZ domain-containing protein [Armatimonadetes bacterium]|nr:PilZ domain-containing protein [Armatimonadota bacterium]
MFEGFLQGLRSLVFGPSSLGKERREVVRLRCYYRVTCCDDHARAYGARVTEMSLLGLRLEGSQRFSRRDRIYVNLPSSPSKDEGIRCTVVWSTRRPTGAYSTGAMYDDSPENLSRSWVKVVLRELGFEEDNIYQKREYVRFASSLQAQVIDGRGGLAAPVTVLNLGVGGALLRCPGPLAEDHTVELRLAPYHGLPAADFPGTVLRSQPDPEMEGERQHNFRFASLGDRSVRLLGRYLIQLLKESR